MVYPPLLHLPNETAYEAHYIARYCQGPLVTFDGIAVWFRASEFKHLFYESTNHDQNKDQFSPKRAERMDWIGATLKDDHATFKQGWVKKLKAYDPNRRVSLVQTDYVVIIWINPTKRTKADFVTAYVADTPKTLSQIQGGPDWP